MESIRKRKTKPPFSGVALSPFIVIVHHGLIVELFGLPLENVLVFIRGHIIVFGEGFWDVCLKAGADLEMFELREPRTWNYENSLDNHNME